MSDLGDSNRQLFGYHILSSTLIRTGQRAEKAGHMISTQPQSQPSEATQTNVVIETNIAGGCLHDPQPSRVLKKRISGLSKEAQHLTSALPQHPQGNPFTSTFSSSNH